MNNNLLLNALRTTFLGTVLILGLSIAFVAIPSFDSAQTVQATIETDNSNDGQSAEPGSAQLVQLELTDSFDNQDSQPVPDQLTQSTWTAGESLVSKAAGLDLRSSSQPSTDYTSAREAHLSRSPRTAPANPHPLFEESFEQPQTVPADSAHLEASSVASAEHSANGTDGSTAPQVLLDGIVDDDPAMDTSKTELSPQRQIFFKPLQVQRSVLSSNSSRIEARLISMEHQLAQLAGSQLERQSTELQKTAQFLQRLQQSTQQLHQATQLNNLESELDRLKLASTAQHTESAQRPTDSQAESSTVNKQPVLRAEPVDERSESFSLTIQDADVAEVLSMLGQLSGLNILAGVGVTGKVTANLQEVTIDKALQAISRSLDLAYERDGNFIFVMPAAQAEDRKNSARRIVTKVYRPQYISATELSGLLTPLLTKGTGVISITQANEEGIAADAEKAGGDSFAQVDAILVRDYEEIVNEMDRIIVEMDVPPAQVVIDAMILSVRLTDEMDFGVNFALLSGDDRDLFLSGNGATINGGPGFPDGTKTNTIVPAMGEFLAQTAGLKYGFIRGNVSTFINALENIADTNLIAAPQLRVVNKQKAELIIGNRISYKTLAFNGTQTVESVNFFDVGTKLLIRPFISPDGNVRMEIHPERSSAVIDQQTGLPNQDTTEVTTNVMIRDGRTVVIGGLIEEQISESLDKIPLLGSLPLVGPAFRNKSERIDRNELIILLTPRIVHDEIEAPHGEAQKFEYERRAKYFSDNLASVNRRNLGRVYQDRATYYFEQGDFRKARFFINEALRNNKNDIEALRLRDQIDVASKRHNWFGWHQGAEAAPFMPEDAPLLETTNDEWNSETIPTTRIVP